MSETSPEEKESNGIAEKAPEEPSEIAKMASEEPSGIAGNAQEESSEVAQNAPEGEKPKLKRGWTDGCYDFVHFGHANQIRQAKELSVVLVVGVHNDSEIAMHKGPPVFNEEERYEMVAEIKGVDEVVRNAPYVTSVETLVKHQCEACFHGDDITTTAEGVDTYEEVKRENKYIEVKRTVGVSTTDLVHRILNVGNTKSSSATSSSPWTRKSAFVATTSSIANFASGKQPKPTDKIVYVVGGFDLFHPGHLQFLKKARELGDYLIVGLLSDETIKNKKGANYPIMSLHERLLSVLAYKPANDVLIGVTPEVTADLLDRFNITAVVDGFRDKEANGEAPDCDDPFAEAKSRGVFHSIDSGSSMTTEDVIRRILDNKSQYEARNAKKEEKEALIAKSLNIV